ncbi:unnamed protein product [Caenorhabditis angaria]|uniref:Decapping nuclease n=1 Tax=Caenorhabditis angaria TaxID=860376 RepID=A0A9P1MX73_9PELO|nr:unnamed protein product [Caenorhabditis angaria]
MDKIDVEIEKIGLYNVEVIRNGEKRFSISTSNFWIPTLKNDRIPVTNFTRILQNPIDVSCYPDDIFEDSGKGEKLESILQYIMYQMNPNETNLYEKIKARFVTNRGLLTNISMRNKSIQYKVVRRKSVYFLFSNEQSTSPSTSRYQNLITSIKLGKYLTDDRNPQMNTGFMTKSVNRLIFPAGITILTSAEIDYQRENGQIVEGKCLLNKTHNHYEEYFRKSVLQSHFGNVDEILVGRKKEVETNYYSGKQYFVYQIESTSRKKFLTFQTAPDIINDGNLRLFNTLVAIQKYLTKDDTALEITKHHDDSVNFREISPDLCDFVPYDFYSRFQ